MSETSSSPDLRLRVGAAIVATGLAGADVARFGLGSKAVVAAFVSVVLVALTVTDLESRRIPNVVVLPAAILVVAARVAFGHGDRWEWPIAGAAAASFLLVAAIASRGGVGMGDVKLALFLGFALGRATVLALLLGLGAAAIYSVSVLLRHGFRARRSAFPLGPFLALGGCVAVLFT